MSKQLFNYDKKGEPTAAQSLHRHSRQIWKHVRDQSREIRRQGPFGTRAKGNCASTKTSCRRVLAQ